MQSTPTMRFASLAALALATTACVVGADEPLDDPDDLIDPLLAEADPAALTAGVNGTACVGSPYNCKFRATGGPRVTTAGGEESWAVDPGASIRDGNGRAMFVQTGSRLTFNYGQTRYLAGAAHALALSTSNRSAGWYPIGRIAGETSFRARMGEVNARDPGRAQMACYRVRDSHDATIELRKVVFDSDSTHERVGDYLPLVRASGERSASPSAARPPITSPPAPGSSASTCRPPPASRRSRSRPGSPAATATTPCAAARCASSMATCARRTT